MGEGESQISNLDSDEPVARLLLDAPIVFDVPGRTVHSPMVDAIVGGVHTRLILDTGATAHVLTLDLAARAHLESQRADPGTDHTGATVESWSLGTVSMDAAGSTLHLQDVQAIKGPPPFAHWGVGGFLSPQSLDPDASVVIDLAGSRLLLVDGDGLALAAWLEKRFPSFHPLSIKREPGEGVRILASIEPFDPVEAMINTGTPDTEFVRTAVPGVEGISAGETGLGVSGAQVAGAHAGGQVLRIGEWAFPLDTLFIRDESAPEHPDAQIGMDLLSGSVLAISPDIDEPVLWMVPNEHGGVAAR
jgi:hypothetical protein